jgi:hypothetical protein
VFGLKDVAFLYDVYLSTCRRLCDRSQWSEFLGNERMVDIVAQAIVDAAKDGVAAKDELEAIALRAVKVRYLRLIH